MSAFLNIFKNKKTRTWGILGAVSIVAIIVSMVFVSTGSANAKSDSVNAAKVVSLQVAETVESSGTLETQPFAALNWKTGGVVEVVNVQPGEMVKAGDVLVILRPDSTSASLASAQADLEAALSNLEALTSPDISAIGQARENASKAFDAWDDARQTFMIQVSYNQGEGDDEIYEDLVQARDDLDAALDDYPLAANPIAQFYYWSARAESLGYRADYDFAALASSLRAELDDQTLAYVDAILARQADFESLAHSFAASMEDQVDAIELMSALGAYEQTSDALLDALRSAYEVMVTPNASDLTSAQAKVDAAQASVNSLRIVAPFDGKVLSVDSRVGDTVTAGELSVNLADMGQLYVEAQVDESDVAKVRDGNPAEVTLDALPGVKLAGLVRSVNPVGEVVGGLVKFTVRIELESVEAGTFLPLGTTANVVIHVGAEQSTLAVPIVAIQNDSQGEYVWVVRDGAAVRVNVVGGAIIGDMVAVTGDLQPGETLEIVYESSFEAPNPMGGGNQ